MRPIKTAAELKARIAELEGKNKSQQVTLKGHFQQTKTALKPNNLMRNSFSSLAEMPEVKKTLISTLIGFGLGYFSRKAQQAMREDSLNRLVSGVIDYSLNKVVQQNPNSLLSQGINMTRHVAQQKGIKLFS
jgi:hypothetical protein